MKFRAFVRKYIVSFYVSKGLVTLLLLALFCESALSQTSLSKVTYLLSVDESGWQSFRVSITVESNYQPKLIFGLPNRLPDTPEIPVNSNSVLNFTAYGENNSRLDFEKLTSNRWLVHTDGNMALRIIYDIQAAQNCGLSHALTPKGTIINPGLVFMFIQGFEQQAVTVRFIMPENWKLLTSLRSTAHLFEYVSESYAHLIDSPIQLGHFQDFYFLLNDKTLNVTINCNFNLFDIDTFMGMIRKIARYQAWLFNEIPFEKYYFMFDVSSKTPLPRDSGHRAACTINLLKKEFIDDVTCAAPNIARQFFRLWNGKRIQPVELQQPDYREPVHISSRWLLDGLTAYFADLTLARANIWSEKELLRQIIRRITYFKNHRQKNKNSVEHRRLFHATQAGSMFESHNEVKGYLLGLLLDFKIREVTRNQQSLDDVMRFMNWWFAKFERGYEEKELVQAFSAVSQYDFREFFEKYVYGSRKFDYHKALKIAGYHFKSQAQLLPDIGELPVTSHLNRILAIEPDSPLAQNGLKVGDQITGIDTIVVKSAVELKQLIDKLPVNSQTTLTVKRNARRVNLSIKVGKKEKFKCEINPNPKATAAQLKVRQNWLEAPVSVTRQRSQIPLKK